MAEALSQKLSAPAATLAFLGKMEYRQAYDLQLRLVEKRREGLVTDDCFLVTEHPPTFTLGRRGGIENLMVSESFLNEQNIPLVHIERGGDITYHGPGQLVMYPIIHLRQCGLSVTDYVGLLEQTMIDLAAAIGIVAVRDGRNHGVWVQGKKLGSVGIAIRHGISFHGLALNVCNSLEHFSWVNPCGLQNVGMTSLTREGNRKISIEELLKDVPVILSKHFHREFVRKRIVEHEEDITLQQY